MNFKLLSRKSCLPLLLGLLVASCGSVSRAAQANDTTGVDELLWWLPDNTESVSVTRGLNARDESQPSSSPVTNIAYVGLVVSDKFLEHFVQLPINFALTGTRNYRDTKGFGLMPFEGCSIIQLKSKLPPDHALGKWLAASASRTTIIDGYKVFIFDQKLEQDQWHFLLVQPSPDVLLCATNRDYLQSVLRRRLRTPQQRAKTARALPTSLPEWTYVDKQSDEWAVRHYRREKARLDPTSPFQKYSFLPDPDARGVAYSLDTSKKNSTLYYLTSAQGEKKAMSVFNELWRGLLRDTGSQAKPHDAPWPLIMKRTGGVVEMKFDWNAAPERFGNWMLSYGLFTLFGHAIVV